jgi:hypothetical protein
VCPDPNPILVEMPNRTYATSTHVAEFNNPNMPIGARTIHLFPHMKEFLLSLGIFCDNGCTSTFTKDNCYIYDSADRVILKGSRNKSTNFRWHLDPHNNQPDFLTVQLNSVATAHSATPAKCPAYTHATLGYPTISCLTTAHKKGFLPNTSEMLCMSIFHNEA